MIEYKEKGYIKSDFFFNQEKIWIREDEGDYKLKPKDFKPGYENVFLQYINNETKSYLGYHVFYFVLLDGYHVLLIIVDNTDKCNPKFIIIDQIKVRQWKNIKEINTELLQMTANNYKGACDFSKRKDINSSLYLWKIKRK